MVKKYTMEMWLASYKAKFREGLTTMRVLHQEERIDRKCSSLPKSIAEESPREPG
jgi:hypothetical protein